jgi:hypothetical protein
MSVFTTYLKTRWTWDYKSNKRKGIACEASAKHANLAANRRLRRLSAKRKLVFRKMYIDRRRSSHEHVPMMTESSNNPCLSV